MNNAYVGRTRETICQKSDLISLLYVQKFKIRGYDFQRDISTEYKSSDVQLLLVENQNRMLVVTQKLLIL